MDLLIYNAAVLRGRWSGVEWAVWQRAIELRRSSPQGVFLLLAPRGVALPDGILEDDVVRLPRFTGCRAGRIFHELFLMPGLVRRLVASHGGAGGRFFAPAYVAPPRLPIPFTLCLYDLHVYTHPEFCTLANRMHYRLRIPPSIRRAEAIEVPSEHVREALNRLFPKYADKAQVRHLALRDRYRGPATGAEVDAVRTKYGLPARYILFVGDPAPRKNLSAALEAWRSVRREEGNGDLAFVLAGDMAPDDMAATSGGPPRAVHTGATDTVPAATVLGYVDDADLPALYSAAEALVYPSFDEGFGLPIVEARACGCPVVTSSPTAWEIAPDAIRCGTDATSIAEALEKALPAQGQKKGARKTIS